MKIDKRYFMKYNIIIALILVNITNLILKNIINKRGEVMSITVEFLFQIFNTLILSLIPIGLVLVIIMFITKHKSTNKKISELENRINKLENK